jgi:hypothetical protein
MKNIKTNRIDKEKLIEYYKKNGNATKTGLEFGLSGPTVTKIVKLYNVPVAGEHKKYTDEYIISKYYECKTAKKTAIELGIDDMRVANVLDRNNIERKQIKHIEVGNVYNKLTVIDFVGYHVTSGGEKNKIYLCKCECGGVREVKSNKLTTNKKPIKDCGCGFIRTQGEWEQKRVEKERKKKELEDIKEQKRTQRLLNKKPPTEKKYKVGYKHHRLTIISEIGIRDDKVFTTQCECGTIKDIRRSNISQIKSCGCLQKERSTIHGHSKKTNPERRNWYHRWKGMVKRCYNDKHVRYMDYGGRGIKVCDKWLEPNGMGCENYYNDIHNILGPQPGPNYSLDRIDNDGIYEITNLQWATISEQNKNRRKNPKK